MRSMVEWSFRTTDPRTSCTVLSRRGRGVLTLRAAPGVLEGEAETGVDLHRAPFIIFGAALLPDARRVLE